MRRTRQFTPTLPAKMGLRALAGVHHALCAPARTTHTQNPPWVVRKRICSVFALLALLAITLPMRVAHCVKVPSFTKYDLPLYCN
jgi:hypothetical protein